MAAMTHETVVCPACAGRGTYVALVRYARPTRCEEVAMTCTTCAGLQTISVEHHLRIKEGERMRRERIDRGESLAEAADRLGIDRVSLSHIEQGRQ